MEQKKNEDVSTCIHELCRSTGFLFYLGNVANVLKCIITILM